MSNILHLRHMKVWLRPDFLFNLTKYGKDQIRLLEIIHGLTKKIIARKKQEYKSGKRNVIDVSAQNGSATQNGNAKNNKVITYSCRDTCVCMLWYNPKRKVIFSKTISWSVSWKQFLWHIYLIFFRTLLWRDFPLDNRPVWRTILMWMIMMSARRRGKLSSICWWKLVRMVLSSQTPRSRSKLILSCLK